MKKLAYATSAAMGALLASPLATFAAETIPIVKPDIVKFTEIGKLISNIIYLIFVLAALIFFFMLVIGGIQWMLSGGDKAATEAALGRITAALIGLVIVFAAWAITVLIEKFLGISILTGGGFTIPTP